jgi:hypothetical protein
MAQKGQGNEVGEIRATIDVGRLNEWLSRTGDVKGAIQVPVMVKQFKVGPSSKLLSTHSLEWVTQYGQASSYLPRMIETANVPF